MKNTVFKFAYTLHGCTTCNVFSWQLGTHTVDPKIMESIMRIYLTLVACHHFVLSCELFAAHAWQTFARPLPFHLSLCVERHNSHRIMIPWHKQLRQIITIFHLCYCYSMHGRHVVRWLCTGVSESHVLWPPSRNWMSQTLLHKCIKQVIEVSVLSILFSDLCAVPIN